jgi:hypothetical protein
VSTLCFARPRSAETCRAAKRKRVRRPHTLNPPPISLSPAAVIINDTHEQSLTIQEASDFDRFQIMLAKKSRRDLVRKAYVKEKKASA